ncbi:MerR family transcriptional regulator [Crossiella cryophila]|uniref:DNA-binding transcriptional MerR regulator n=2 Tax=Crossiella cryophila TaxID=43355 RepID=A0A7W7FT01_9PSEU|nr:MerR family transcriptional regulator [Crossiella cryophila]MBB4674274.1 DNA-binding transcriptional MerR regulator [Crossiella cryophila]
MALTSRLTGMRMAELSAESGVPVGTIKFYLREQLLPPGERTSPNQARYSAEHVRRLKLVRALMETGGFSVAEVRRVVDSLDNSAGLFDTLAVAQYGLTHPAAEDADWAYQRLRVAAADRGWVIDPADPAGRTAAGLLNTFRELGHERLLDRLERYVELAEGVAKADLDQLDGLSSPEAVVETAVVGTVLGDALFAALRRLAQQQEAARRFGSGEPVQEP